jgi:ribose transport system substrate-binding protein
MEQRQMRVHLRLLYLLALITVPLAGCIRETTQNGNGTPGNATATTGKKGANERLTLAVVPKGTTHAFWLTIRAGAEAAGKDVNAEIKWNGPKQETDIQDQINIIDGFASEGVDGVALAATSKDSLVDTVKELEAKGIPVVTIDSGIEPDVSRSFIATDNVEAARQAAKELGRLLGGKGKVAVLTFLKGAGTSDQREQGFMGGIKEFPDIKVVSVQETKSDTGKARDVMETILTAHPDLAGVFASNEPNVIGAAGVIEEKKLTGKVKLVGFDGADAEIEALKEGVVQALMVQDPFKMGYEGVKALAMILRGQGTPPKRIDTGITTVTKENLETPEVQKLLNPLGK